ncbi:homeodomain-interacting protein kinase 2-like [Genypterus blacodes]|uniref:homeodomain-interacting protein kinase 2-like n=1 Tax=Genypterus blacodes TaxID=154954 RepID=UPI003F777949
MSLLSLVLCFQVATALNTLGKLKVVHADVTPANIMLVDKLRKPFKVKLTDFGSAVWKDQLKRRDPPVQSHPFRSPEILLGHTFNRAIDMWSLGCVMARMFIGCDLFPGTSDYEVMRSIVDLLGKPSPVSLWTGSKTLKYFELEWKSLMPCWTLKKPNDPCQDITKFIESRQYSFTSLDVLKEATDGEISLADDDKNTCVKLIKRMLDLRMKKRIKPYKVLTHPFITRSFSDTTSVNSKKCVFTPQVLMICT